MTSAHPINFTLDQLDACFAVAAGLVSLGLLPMTWQKTLGVAGAALWLARRF